MRAPALLAMVMLGFLSGPATASAVTYPAYDHARVLGVVNDAGARVALTFDDCSDATAWRSILSTLRARGVHAAFFCPAKVVRDHVTLARRVRSDGNMLCNHGWSHPDLTTLTPDQIFHQLRLARNVLYGLTGSRCDYMRPPYGSYNRDVLRIAGQLGYRRAVLWTVDPNDWQQPASSAIRSRVLSATHAGSIVLLHVLPQTAAALPAILRGLRSERLVPVSLSKLVAAGKPAPGGWPRYSAL